MFQKGQQLSAKNLNNAYISKIDTNAQVMNSNLTVSGGVLSLKNSVITDSASSSYMRIDPQGNSVIIYDGVNNQSLSVYSSSGSEATTIQTINGTNGALSIGQIDVSSAVDHLEIATNTKKKTQFGGKIEILNGNDLVLKAVTNDDAGDIVFQTSGGTELARIYSSSGGVLNLSSGTNTDAQIQMTDSAISLNEPTTVSGKITNTSGGIDIQGSGSALNFTFGGGGFQMIDSTWIRTTGSKSFYHNTGSFRTDGTLQVGNGGATLSVPSGGDVTAGFNVLAKNFVVSGGTSSDTVNNSPWYGIGRANTLYGTFSGGQTGVQVAGYYGVNLKTQNGELILDPSYSSAPKYNGNPMWHSGNMGAGSNLDADKLDGVQGSQYLRSDTSDTFTGTLTLTGNQTISGTLDVTGKTTLGTVQATSIGSGENGIYLPIVGGGQHKQTTSTATGAIAITLPVSWTNTMMKFEVDVYDYDTGESFTVFISGYNYDVSSAWVNTSAYILTGNKVARNFTVRFGHDGTKCVVYIGETNSAWSYPQFVVRNFYGGFQGATFDNWNDGWSVGFATTMGTITSTITDTYVRASDADTLDGINSSQFVRNDQSGTISGNITITGNIVGNSAITSAGLLTASNSLSVVNTATVSGGTATPLVLKRSSNSNVNMQFVHTSANAFFGIDNAGNFKVGTVADLNASGTKIWHEGNDGSGSTLDADTVDGVQASSFVRNDSATTMGVGLLFNSTATGGVSNANPTSLSYGKLQSYGTFNILADTDGSQTEYLYLSAGYSAGAQANGVEIGYNSFKWKGNTIWHAGNDGSGSTLDADTVDGIESARIIYGDNSTGATTITDMDSIWKSGFYQGNDVTNAPSTGWYWVMNTAHTSNSGTYKYNGQMAFKNISTGSPEAYIRTTAGNITKTNWGRLWHDQNDGSGSGLDADLIRGQEPFIDRGYLTSGGSVSGNANNIINRGISRVYWSGMTNRPTSYDWGQLVLLEGGGARTQVFYADTDGTDGGMYFREDYGSDNTWTNWRKVWDDRNDGSGSGLDADKLDGVEGANFLRSDIADTYTTLSGGAIYLNAGSAIYSQYGSGNFYILKDHNNGNVTVNGAGGTLYLGYVSTTQVRLSASLVDDTATPRTIIDTAGKLYYQGNDIEARYSKKSGDTWTGTHTLSEATLSWSRDTDTASLSLVDYGTDTDWLTLDVGDRDTDLFRIRGADSAGTFQNIADFKQSGHEFYVDLDMNNHNVNGIKGLYGQFGTIITSTDEWLRINSDGTHTSGVYLGSSVVRTDNELQVGATGNSFKASSNGDVSFIGNMYVSNNKAIYMKNTAGNNYSAIQIDNTDKFLVGTVSNPTTLYGSAISLSSPSVTLTNASGQLLWDRGRTAGKGRIYWNASSTAQYGMVFQTDDTTVFTLGNSSGDSILNTTLRITPEIDVNGATGGSLIIGNDTGFNMRMDGNEIQTMNSGNTTSLNLNTAGGTVAIGADMRFNLDNSITVTNGVVTKTAIDFYGPTDSGNSGFGVAIGAGGQVVIGSGESAQTFKSGWQVNNANGGANEVTYITSDNSIYFYPNQNSGYDVSKYMSYTNGQIELQGTSQTLQIGVTKYYNGSASGGDSIYNPAGQVIIGGNTGVTAWAETTSFIVKTGPTGNSVTRFEVQQDGDVLANGRYVNTHYHAPAYEAITTSGWYTIATTETARAYGRFIIMDSASSRHELVDFTAGTAYAQEAGMNIHVQGRVKYGSVQTIGGIRIMSNPSDIYAKQYLQVYCVSGANVQMYMEDYGKLWASGWDPVNFTLQNTITGYNDYKFEMQDGYAKPINIASGATLPSEGMGIGDVFVVY